MGCGATKDQQTKRPVTLADAAGSAGAGAEANKNAPVKPAGAYELDVGGGDGPDDPNAAVEERSTVTLEKGITYTGQWKGNKKHGHGKQVYPDGASYDGEWADGLAEGKGIFIHADGTTYDGEWSRGKANGQGILTQPNGYVTRYEGEWKDDFRHGFGKEERKDANGSETKYEGMFLNGKMQGRGRLEWDTGEEKTAYDGELQNDELNGWGLYAWPDRMYCGQWQENLIQGYGIFTWGDGRTYRGQYNLGKKEGWGVFDWPDGKQYRGWWKNNKHQGYGSFRSAKGVIKHVEYNAGQRVRWLEEEDVEAFKKENDIPDEPELPEMPSWLVELADKVRTGLTVSSEAQGAAVAGGDEP